jgi:hypothetical protein
LLSGRSGCAPARPGQSTAAGVQPGLAALGGEPAALGRGGRLPYLPRQCQFYDLPTNRIGRRCDQKIMLAPRLPRNSITSRRQQYLDLFARYATVMHFGKTGRMVTASVKSISDKGRLMGGGINFVPSCFLRGTHIRTPRREVPVDELAIGQQVLTVAGAARPVKWVGRRAYDPRFIKDHPEIFPILVRRDALADGLPQRDLYLSQGHALLIDGRLIQVELLENGVSIRRLPRWTEPLEYFHVELDSHDVIFAEGVPAESFNDSDNRNQFQNADEFWRLYPDHRSSGALDWAPRVISGPRLDTLREHLSQRALADNSARQGRSLRTSAPP